MGKPSIALNHLLKQATTLADQGFPREAREKLDKAKALVRDTPSLRTSSAVADRLANVGRKIASQRSGGDETTDRDSIDAEDEPSEEESPERARLRLTEGAVGKKPRKPVDADPYGSAKVQCKSCDRWVRPGDIVSGGRCRRCATGGTCPICHAEKSPDYETCRRCSSRSTGGVKLVYGGGFETDRRRH